MPRMWVTGESPGPPRIAMRSRTVPRATGEAAGGAGAGAEVADSGVEVDRSDMFRTDASALEAPRRPIVTCTYPNPSGVSGQTTLAQLPRLRETGRTLLRDARPTTGVPMLGPWCTSAEGTVTVST